MMRPAVARSALPLALLVLLGALGCSSGPDDRDEPAVGLYVRTFEARGEAQGLEHLKLEERAASRLAEQAARVEGVRLVAPLPPVEVEDLRQAYELYTEQKGVSLRVDEGRPDVTVGGTVEVSDGRVEFRAWFRRKDGERNESVVQGEVRKAADADPLLRELALSVLSACFPRDARVLMRLGITLSRNGLHGRALEVYRRVQALDPANPAVHYNMGLAFDRLGQLDAAVRAYEKAVEIRPDYHHALWELAVNSQVPPRPGETEEDVARRFARAEECYRRVLDVEPRHKEARYGYARFLRMRRRFHDALDQCRQLMQFFPADPAAPRMAGLLSLDLEQYERALAFFQKATELEPLLVSNDYFLASAFDGLGREEDAHRHYRRFVQLAGTDEKFRDHVIAARKRIAALDQALKERHVWPDEPGSEEKDGEEAPDPGAGEEPPREGKAGR